MSEVAGPTAEPENSEAPSGPDEDSSARTMPTWIPRAITIFLAGAVALWIGAWMVFRLRSLLIMLAVALFASFALEPGVNWLSSKGMRRGLATGLVLLAGFAATVAFLGLIGQAVVTEVSDFVEELPNYLVDVEDWLNRTFNAEVDFNDLISRIRQEDDQIQELAADVAPKALDITFSAIGLLFQLFTVVLFTFYMVADGPRFRRTVLQFLPPKRQERVLAGWEVAIDKTGGYIYSRALLAALSAAVTSIFLAILGVPFALALGLFTGIVSQFVPTIGTYIGGAVPVLIALSEDPVDGLLVLVFIIVYQQIENYFFAPKITAQTMDLHPAVAFGTVIAGASLFGAIGAVLALPAAAVIQAVGSTYVHRHEVIDTEMTREHQRGRRKERARGSPDGSSDTADAAETPDTPPDSS